MDIEVVIKKSFVFAGLFAAVIIVYSLPLFIFQNLFQQAMGISRNLAAALTILAMMFGYERLKSFLVEVTDKYLFQKKYEYRKALAQLGKETTRLMKVETFTRILNRNVVRIIKLSGSSVVVLNRKTSEYVVLAAARSHKVNLGRVFPIDSPLIPEMEKVDYLLSDDLERNLKDERLDEVKKERIKKILEVMKEFNAVLCVPSRFEMKVVGFMLFGEKLSQDVYSEEDLDLFVTISRQIALAINNSYLYEESLEKERELAKREVEKHTERIRRLASLGELAAGVAHEIRNPMTVLRSRAEDLENEIENKIYLQEFAGLTVKHIDRILNIVNNMLRFAREREKITFALLHINDVLNDTLTLAAGRLKGENIEVVKNFNSQKPTRGESGMLQQAFLNVVMNSFDFMSSGGTLTINTFDRDGWVVVEVVDTGSGIPPEQIEHIFDPFFTTRAEGTGLGLSITYRIIQEHNGRIEVASETGQGAKFTIFLPVA
jgi:signal transduction histidine kinase